MRLLVLVLALLVCCEAGFVCHQRQGTCVLDGSTPTTYNAVYRIFDQECQLMGAKQFARLDKPTDCGVVDQLGCCCTIIDGKNNMYDVCTPAEATKFDNTKKWKAKDHVVPSIAPMLQPDQLIPKLKFNPKAPDWMWEMRPNLIHLEFNPVMYYAPPQKYLADINAYKLDYFAQLFASNTPFRPVIEALVLLHTTYSVKVPVVDFLIHHSLNSLYQGIKTFRFIEQNLKQDKVLLSAEFRTKQGDHVFSNSLIGKTSPLQALRAVFFDPYQVTGHVDPANLITYGQQAFKLIDSTQNEHVQALILISYTDCSAWARLYDPNMRIDPKLTTSEVHNVGTIITKDIATRFNDYKDHISGNKI